MGCPDGRRNGEASGELTLSSQVVRCGTVHFKAAAVSEEFPWKLVVQSAAADGVWVSISAASGFLVRAPRRTTCQRGTYHRVWAPVLAKAVLHDAGTCHTFQTTLASRRHYYYRAAELRDSYGRVDSQLSACVCDHRLGATHPRGSFFLSFFLAGGQVCQPTQLRVSSRSASRCQFRRRTAVDVHG